MTGVRSHPMALGLLSAVAAATTLVSLLTWQGFTEQFGSTLGPLFVVAVVVAGTGAVGRWWRLPRPLLVLAQTVLVAMVVCAFVCGSPLPIGEAWNGPVLAFQDAAQSANRFAPPVPSAEPPVHPLLIAGGAGCLLLVDVLACTLRRVPLAGLPLLTIYSVPVSMNRRRSALDPLHLHRHRVPRDDLPVGVRADRALGPDPRGGPRPLRAEAPLGADLAAHRRGCDGGVATALSLVVPVLIPTFSVHLFDFGRAPAVTTTSASRTRWSTSSAT